MIDQWRIAEVAQLQLEYPDTPQERYVCKLCLQWSEDAEKIEHAECCPVELLRLDEGAENGTL